MPALCFLSGTRLFAARFVVCGLSASSLRSAPGCLPQPLNDLFWSFRHSLRAMRKGAPPLDPGRVEYPAPVASRFFYRLTPSIGTQLYVKISEQVTTEYPTGKKNRTGFTPHRNSKAAKKQNRTYSLPENPPGKNAEMARQHRRMQREARSCFAASTVRACTLVLA